MSDKKFSGERLQREKLKLPVKNQEILFYFTKDHAERINLMMSKVSSQGNSTAVEATKEVTL